MSGQDGCSASTHVSFGQEHTWKPSFSPKLCCNSCDTGKLISPQLCTSCRVRSAHAVTMSTSINFCRVHRPVMGGQHITTPSPAVASVSPQASYISMDYPWPGDATVTFIAVATLLQKRKSRKSAPDATVADASS